jgi:uncharacterized protein (TIGR02270 family)
MAGLRTTYIPELLEMHFEELQFLWGRRQSILRSPVVSMRQCLALEERIEGHVQGLLVARDRVIPLLEEGLTADESAATFAASYPLLRLGTEQARTLVMDAFTSAEGARRRGLAQALCHAPMDKSLRAAAQAAFFSAAPSLSAAAAEVLAFHRLVPPELRPIEQLLGDENPSVRRSGWRVVAILGLPVGPKLYAAAMRDDEVDIRTAAVHAAAWSALPAALAIGRDVGRETAAQYMGALELLGILGTPEDLPRITAIGKLQDLGPARFQILACFGHPGLVDLLLPELASSDPAIACAAGAAFTKMTGENIDSKTSAKLPPEDGHEPDEFETEFLEEVRLPDPEIARKHWEKVKPRLARAIRICRGFDISQGVTAEALASLDMESRWEFFLRSKYTGKWTGSPADLERFPQPR